MRTICLPENCTGCLSCSSVCRHEAIRVIEDDLGFVRPIIDEEKCMDCGACRRVCPELNRVGMRFPTACYAAAVSDCSQSSKYASGGVASAISRTVIENGGVVVACCGNDITNVSHRIISTMEEVACIAGSKYVQSRITPGLLREIEAELQKGTEVLFIGTGCQTAGIKNLFSNRYSNLLLVDLVCHGVPSQRMLNDNIAYYGRKYPGFDPRTVHFREKHDGKITYGWYAETKGKDGFKIAVPWRKDAYMAAFMDHISLRPCCTQCRYAFSARATDVTLCDFWGLGNDSVLKGRNGVSAVLINTEKGDVVFKDATGLDSEKREIGEVIKGVGRLQTPSPSNPKAFQFRALYVENGLQYAVSKTAFAKFKRERIKSIPVLGSCIRMISLGLKRIQ